MCYNKSQEELFLELKQLEIEHAEMKEIIDSESSLLDEVTLQRIKKRKLKIKDEIIKIKSRLHPDIIA